MANNCDPMVDPAAAKINLGEKAKYLKTLQYKTLLHHTIPLFLLLFRIQDSLQTLVKNECRD